MTLEQGQRVKLAADLRLAGSVVLAEDPAADTEDPPADTGAVAGSLSLASGIEGTVERVNDPEQEEQSREVLEYVRLKSLLDDFGHQMPTGTRKQLEEQVRSLEPEWIAYQEQTPRVTVRVRFDNGFVLDDAHEGVFASV
ncbi:hypothetical protein ABT237_40185 [Streptomyces sp. NPDC001581]|uniref:hypothetical protein n=1 Tax=Streptomyces sp. NPDC001581 TaxID=3154386 RepID=UPI0033297FEB